MEALAAVEPDFTEKSPLVEIGSMDIASNVCSDGKMRVVLYILIFSFTLPFCN